MAKGAQKRKESGAPARAAASSMLATAYAAYERGDVVRAREAAGRALALESSEAEAQSARKLSPLLFPHSPQTKTVRELAAELSSRTEVPRRPYLFAGVGAVLIVLMLLLALART